MSHEDHNDTLLHFIAQNARMGKQSIKQLLPTIQNETFRSLVESQYREYDAIDDLCAKALQKRHQQPPDVPMAAKISSYIMIHVNAAKDGDVSSMAEMMLKGSNQGIIEITKHLNTAGDAVHSSVKTLAERLLQFEQDNVEALRPYLKA